MYASNILGHSKEGMHELQRIQNNVYRTILAASRYGTLGTLRDETGANNVEARMKGTQKKYIKYIDGNEARKLKRIIPQDGRGRCKEYLIKSAIFLLIFFFLLFSLG